MVTSDLVVPYTLTLEKIMYYRIDAVACVISCTYLLVLCALLVFGTSYPSHIAPLLNCIIQDPEKLLAINVGSWLIGSGAFLGFLIGVLSFLHSSPKELKKEGE